ncbi:RidA family protein [Nonomuraea sp. MG754425]|uniref:RidA family protein n=1 Tax=Nonomuraea sp. MG754425 TaxID=2570319 RepID=UPI001F460B7C|nr:RidA family protein [Nonomuraea sp. MG754425]
MDIDPRSYSNCVSVTEFNRLLFVTAQVPLDDDGKVPEGFDAQCRLAWRNLLAVLESAGMGAENLVKISVFLADRGDREANARIRHEVLGEHAPAQCIVVAGIYDEEWLVAIDAVAAG